MHRECFTPTGWKVLAALGDTVNKHNAVLAGGTALALHLGHRKSVDLDFFTTSSFRVETVISVIRKTGLNIRIMSEAEDYLVCEIEGVKFSLFRYEYPFIDTVSSYEGTNVAGVLDIAAMKIIDIVQRGTKRDFVDMYFILQQVPFYKIADHMVRRFGVERVNPIHIGKALTYFTDADSNSEPEYTKEKVKWEKVKAFFVRYTKQFVLDLRNAVQNGQGDRS